MRTIEQMVQQEVLCCVSSLVSVLAQGCPEPELPPYSGGWTKQNELALLCEKALELCVSGLDYAEAAFQHGWRELRSDFWRCGYGTDDERTAVSAEQACEIDRIDPCEREIFEHWAVTDWLAAKLEAEGERVGDLGDLKVWGRFTTGQAIEMDGVIRRIYAAMLVA